MNVLVTNAPVGHNYDLQSTNQGDLPVEVAASAGGGGGFSDSGTVGLGGELTTPKILVIANAPPAFASVVVTGWVSISWTNIEAESIEASGTVTIEISTDSGVTWSAIGDPLGYSGANPVTANNQQLFVSVPFTTRTTGPATGNVEIRATIADNTTGGSLAGGQVTAAGVFLT